MKLVWPKQQRRRWLCERVKVLISIYLNIRIPALYSLWIGLGSYHVIYLSYLHYKSVRKDCGFIIADIQHSRPDLALLTRCLITSANCPKYGAKLPNNNLANS